MRKRQNITLDILDIFFFRMSSNIPAFKVPVSASDFEF